MNAVAFYSNTGESRAIAEYFADKLGYFLVDIEAYSEENYKDLVLVFPVHCQNIPDPVKAFLEKVDALNLTVISTYGKMCCGNVLYEIQRKYRKNIVAGAYLPTKHAYIDGDCAFSDFDKLDPIIEKIQKPSSVRFPKLYKNPFANFVPALRSRIGLKIQKSTSCNGCDICSEICSFGAIKEGITNNKCIRCLKCVDKCPLKALSIHIGSPLKLYLRKKKKNKIIIYV